MSVVEETAYVALGSNLADPRHQVEQALRELDCITETTVTAHSPLYLTPPLGPPGQADYVNAVARLRTRLEPLALLDALQAIEAAHARVRGEHWGPRTLDLDLLLFGERSVEHPRLRVPHAEMHRRAFVLVPLYDIDPDLTIPGHGALHTLVQTSDRAGMRRLAEGDDD